MAVAEPCRRATHFKHPCVVSTVFCGGYAHYNVNQHFTKLSFEPKFECFAGIAPERQKELQFWTRAFVQAQITEVFLFEC